MIFKPILSETHMINQYKLSILNRYNPTHGRVLQQNLISTKFKGEPVKDFIIHIFYEITRNEIT